MRKKFGLPMFLFIVFSILKLTNNIDWPWVWVTSPIWITMMLIVSIVIISFLIVIFALIFGFSLTEIAEAAESFRSKINSKTDKN